MSKIAEFKNLLAQIDRVLNSYQPPDLSPHRYVREIIAERAAQRPIFEEAIQLATEGLEKYPFSPELLRRRAHARCQIITPEGETIESKLVQEDLELLLAIDPNNLFAAYELIEDMFTFSSMEDKDVAEMTRELASRTEDLLLAYRSLQIKALSFAGEQAQAEEVYNRWQEVFPDSEILKSAQKAIDSMKHA